MLTNTCHATLQGNSADRAEASEYGDIHHVSIDNHQIFSQLDMMARLSRIVLRG
jgi:hypothetical protein